MAVDDFDLLEALVAGSQSRPAEQPEDTSFEALEKKLANVAPRPIALTPEEQLVRDHDDKLDKMREILEGYFPGNWDLQVNRANGWASRTVAGAITGSDYSTYTVIVKFPEVYIENGAKGHTMYDIYHNLDFISNFKMYAHSMRRGKVTYPEYLAGYNYSHAFAGTSQEWKGLCLGHTTFATLVTSLQTEGYNEANFEMYLLQLLPYYQWESLATTPYISINSLGTTRIQNYLQNQNDLISTTKSMLEDDEVGNKVSLATNNKIGVVRNAEFARMVSKHAPPIYVSLFDPETNQFVSSTESNLDEAALQRLNRQISGTNARTFRFKDEYIQYTVINAVKQAEIDTKKYENRCHNNIVQAVADYIDVALANFHLYEVHRC